MNNTADLLDKAADLLEESGHCKFALYREGSHCAFGAINKANSGSHDWNDSLGKPDDNVREAAEYLADYLCLSVSPAAGWAGWEHVEAVVDWNNAEEREGWEVVNAFRHTAKSLRGE